MPKVRTRARAEYVESLFDALVKRHFVLVEGTPDIKEGPAYILLPLLSANVSINIAEFEKVATDCNVTCARHTLGLHASFPLRNLTRGMMPESSRIAEEFRNALVELMGVTPGDRWLDILDLGCGTGAIGARVRDLSDYILGIDVSSVSLKAAARRSVYDKLEHMDIVHGLAKIRLAFDALLMGDVVPYFSKDLGMVLKRAARVLRAEGVLLLSFDIHSSSKDYVLQPTGRWTFSESHIKCCCRKRLHRGTHVVSGYAVEDLL